MNYLEDLVTPSSVRYPEAIPSVVGNIEKHTAHEEIFKTNAIACIKTTKTNKQKKHESFTKVNVFCPSISLHLKSK